MHAEDLAAREAEAAGGGGVVGLHPGVRGGEAVCPVFLLVESCGVFLIYVHRGDLEVVGCLRGQTVDVPVEREREVY